MSTITKHISNSPNLLFFLKLMVYNGTIIVCGSPEAVGLEYAILHFKN
jgi:hypothetical protein